MFGSPIMTRTYNPSVNKMIVRPTRIDESNRTGSVVATRTLLFALRYKTFRAPQH